MQRPIRSLTHEPYLGWPAHVLRQGSLCLRVVAAVGGRLMGISHAGQDICFVHPQLAGQTWSGQAADWPALCGEWGFPLWGGGKTWVAPESAWPQGAPHRDLDSLPWQVRAAWCSADSMGVEVQSPVCRDSGLQISRRLTLPAQGAAWTVEHTLVNCGSTTQDCGLWDVLMLKRPGLVTLALDAAQPQGLCALPGREALATLVRDGVVQQSAAQAQVHCHTARAFKLGFFSEAGRVQVDFETPSLRYARHSAVQPGQSWAHGHPLEVFNAPALDYFEVETHSPLQRLAPGDSLHYTVHERVEALPAAAQTPFTLTETENT